jgi:hypothetical protein
MVVREASALVKARMKRNHRGVWSATIKLTLSPSFRERTRDNLICVVRVVKR